MQIKVIGSEVSEISNREFTKAIFEIAFKRLKEDKECEQNKKTKY